MVRVFFDGVLVENPKEWRELSVTIKTDHLMQTTLIEYHETLTFINDGFEFLYALVDDDCEVIEAMVEMEVEGVYETIIRGSIFVTECLFDELNCEAKTIIQDDGHSTRVQNNKNIQSDLSSEVTKNGLPIVAAAHEVFYMYEPATGTPFFLRQGFTPYECFKYMVSWMTDNKVGFESDYFQTGNGSKSFILSGKDVRTGDFNPSVVQQFPKFKFAELFEVFRKLENIGIGYKRDATGKPIMVIEDIGFFRGSNVVLDLNNVNKTELDFLEELLFARIIVGGSIIFPWECDNGNTRCTAANNLIYFGFENEEFGFTGECNKDIALDLTIPDNYVVDTSTIEDVIMYNNEAFDDNNFIVRWFEKPPFGYAYSTMTDVIGVGRYWYNEYFTNKEVIARYQEYLFGNILLYGLLIDIHLMEVGSASFSSLLNPLQFPAQENWAPDFTNIIYDVDDVFQLSPDNKFQPRDEGLYKMDAGVGWERDASSSTSTGLQVEGYFKLDHYNESGTFLATYNSTFGLLFPMFTGPGEKFDERTFPWINMAAMDYLVFSVEYWQNFSPNVAQSVIRFVETLGQTHYLRCDESKVVMKNEIATSGAERRIRRTTTEGCHVPWSEMKDYLNDTTQRIRLSNQRIDRVGWNNEITHNFITGETELSILSNDV